MRPKQVTKIPDKEMSREPSPTNFNQTWQAHITVNADRATTTLMQNVKAQGYVRRMIDLEE